MIVRESVELGHSQLSLETGKLAKQANASVTVQFGDTVVMVTVCASKKPREGQDFFPLTVEYVEKTYSAGKIPGGFFKREGRLSSHEILASRLTDRPIRPLFPDGYRNEVQVIATVLSADRENDSTAVVLNGASAALCISNIPFQGPVGAIRVGRLDGQFVANPTFEQQDRCDVNLIVAAGREGITMVEGDAGFVEEDVILDALMFAVEQINPILDAQESLAAKVGKAKTEFQVPTLDPQLKERVRAVGMNLLIDALGIHDKLARYSALDDAKASIKERLIADDPELAEQSKAISECIDELKKEYVRGQILEGKRIGGRGLADVRAIACEVGILPRTHGSSLFTRGETQALATITLGTSQDEQRLDLLHTDTTKSFMLHYNFPPYCVGEVKMLRGPSRREIGHGVLAERGVAASLPDKADFPYTIRIVSEVLESNGSSSMATVCGSSLALMDAGVPVKCAVAGVAMGLIKEKGEFRVLTDILGDEDHLGDMDFKVVGNAAGISALQMDIKCDGVTRAVLKQALDQAKVARLHILGEMEKALSAPRDDISPYAPRIFTLKINPDKIRDVIGPGGKIIRSIVDQTGVQIDIEDDGTVKIASTDQASADKAIKLIRDLTEEPEVGNVYNGFVVRVVDFGAFIRILPNTEGLCHISELSDRRVRQVTDVLSEGDEVMVKVLAIDRQGKIRLSRKAVLADMRGSDAEGEGAEQDA
ncbi:MAG: polyribonucleotide nucleotidyltransferase [Myxococcales bacterium]|nr:polyribonucleotide nucleotidyltransferase [Myxococcales bacterium]